MWTAWLVAAAAAHMMEPGLVETLEAAARAAGGSLQEDASRTRRAQNAHWAPQVRGEVLGKEDERDRTGEFRLAPLRDHAVGSGRGWVLMLTWDLSQVVYAREESQLALAHAHLARLRREAQARAADLWVERRKVRAASSPASAERCLALLRLTAELDALTAGLFRDQLSQEQALCNPEESK